MDCSDYIDFADWIEADCIWGKALKNMMGPIIFLLTFLYQLDMLFLNKSIAKAHFLSPTKIFRIGRRNGGKVFLLIAEFSARSIHDHIEFVNTWWKMYRTHQGENDVFGKNSAQVLVSNVDIGLSILH